MIWKQFYDVHTKLKSMFLLTTQIVNMIVKLASLRTREADTYLTTYRHDANKIWIQHYDVHEELHDGLRLVGVRGDGPQEEVVARGVA